MSLITGHKSYFSGKKVSPVHVVQSSSPVQWIETPLIKVTFVSYIPQTLCFHGSDPTHCKQSNNYCTTFAAISQNAYCEHHVKCSNFGTVGKLTIWRTWLCLETGFNTFHRLNKSWKVHLWAKMDKHWNITTYRVCVHHFQPDSSTTITAEKLLKISAPNSFSLPSTKRHKVTLSPAAGFVWLAYESKMPTAAWAC